MWREENRLSRSRALYMWRVRARHAVPLLKNEAKAKFKKSRQDALRSSGQAGATREKIQGRIKGAGRSPAVLKATAELQIPLYAPFLRQVKRDDNR
jgi:hypothetical protein